MVSIGLIQAFQIFNTNSVYAKVNYDRNPHKFTPSQLRTFRESAQDFWGDRGELSVQGYPVNCTPRNVRIYYEYNVGGGYIARVKNLPYPDSNVGVVRNVFTFDADYYHGEAHEIMLNSYCKIFFNLAETFRYDTPTMCTIFIHEYGHLLGKNHVLDRGSPLYNGYSYIEGSGLQMWKDFGRWQAKVQGKSWCRMRNAPHLINYPH